MHLRGYNYGLKGLDDRRLHWRNAHVKVNLWVTTHGRNRSARFKPLRFCKSNPCMPPPPPLWFCSQIMNISWPASDTMPRKIFQLFFFAPPPIETLGLECVTEAWSQSVALRQGIGFVIHGVDDIRWTFSFVTQEPLPPPLINRWTVLSLASRLKRSVLSVTFCWVEKWFQSTQSGSRVLTNGGQSPRLNSVALEWLSRGESAGISSVLNTAFSVLRCPLAFSK